jgi:hypothetical protein
MLIRHLDTAFLHTKPAAVRHRTITPLLPDMNFLLSAIANADATYEKSELDAAFHAGVQALALQQRSSPWKIGRAHV